MRLKTALGLLSCAVLVSCGHGDAKKAPDTSTSPQVASDAPSYEMDGIFFKNYPYTIVSALARIEDSLLDIEGQYSISGYVAVEIKIHNATKKAEVKLWQVKGNFVEALPGSFSDIPAMKLKAYTKAESYGPDQLVKRDGQDWNSMLHYKGEISKGYDYFVNLHVTHITKELVGVSSRGTHMRDITLVHSGFQMANPSNMRERTIEFLKHAGIFPSYN